MRLRLRILLYTSVLILSLLAAMFVYINNQAGQFVNQGIAAELERGRNSVATVEEGRLSNLRLTAGLVATFPNLKALLSSTDAATIRDFLFQYQRTNPHTDLLIILDTQGHVIARTDLPDPRPIPDAESRWIKPLLAGQSAAGILETETGLYHAAAMPSEISGRVFGFVIAGARIDDAFAANLAEFSESEILIATDRVIAASPNLRRLTALPEWTHMFGNDGNPSVMNTDDGSYAVLATQLSGNAAIAPRVLLLRSRDEALAPYRRIRTGLVLLVLLVALAAVIGSAVLARNVTAPIGKLLDGTNRVAAGNLDFQLDIRRSDELGDLARSFNTMVTERKRLEEQFRQAQKMEAVGRLAGGVAHDFNNLLTAIGGYSQLVYEKLDADNKLRKHVHEVIKAGERAASLTRQLLAFSRRQMLTPRAINLNDVISEMKNMLGRLVGEDIEIATNLDPELGLIKADPGQMEQVLMNLVVNARDAMARGGRISISTRHLHLENEDHQTYPGVAPGSHASFSVKDSGSGMTQEVLSHLFEPFFTTKEPGKGTGLGLATVYGIVHQSGGQILVDSTVGEGSTFTVILPRAAEESAAAQAPKGGQESLAGSETVLVVEDEDAVRSLAVQVLRRHGYKVLEACNGLEALTVCDQFGPQIDLILTDVVMPRMSGAEMAERVASRHPNIKLLYMSGYLEVSIDSQVKVNPDAVFLQKPFTPEALAAKVRTLLNLA